MDDTEREDACYKPSGIPVTPQARKLGYEFPVYVSDVVWRQACVFAGSSRLETTLDRRIYELISSCYDGMIKRLTQDDEFVYYKFKHWFWPPLANANTKKKRKRTFGARLFLNENGEPWLYIFDIERDSIEALEKGELNEEEAL